MPDIPGANWYRSKLKPVPLKLPTDNSVLLQNQMRRLDGVKEQLQDLQTQLATLAGVVDSVMDVLYDIKETLEKKEEDK